MKLLKVGLHAIDSTAKKGGGRFGWCATTKARWKQFCQFCCGLGVSTVDEIDAEILQQYAHFCGRLAVATAQNYVSSVNVVMRLISKKWVPVSPKGLIGKSRTSVRKKPVSFSYSDIQFAIDELENLGKIELATVVFVAANFGLRRRESALLDIKTATKEVKKQGSFDVVKGTKGGRGRQVSRLIPCDEMLLRQLEKINEKIESRRSLIPESMNLKQFYDEISNCCLPVLRKNGIERLHDLRVYYACKRYEFLTGCIAPCNRKIGDDFASALIDLEAREKISNELGHSRIQIVSAYIGRKSRRGNLNAHQFNSGC